MLQLILGRAGSGKSRYLLEEIGALARDGVLSALLVPEQFTLQTEKWIQQALGPRAAALVNVLSFARLPSYVARLAGGAGEHIDAAGRRVAMGLAVRRSLRGLEAYGAAAQRPEFVVGMQGVAAELTAYRVTPEQLQDAAGALDMQIGGTTRAGKLRDIAAIYAAYRSIIEGELGCVNDELTAATAAIERCGLFAGARVYLDAFMGFTPLEQYALERILRQCERMTVSLCLDALDGGDGVFAHIRNTARALCGMCERAGIKVAQAVTLTGCGFEREDIAYLERALYDMGARPFDGKPGGVRVIRAADTADECEFVAREALRLVREDELRWRDIVVVTRDMDTYGRRLERAFARRGAPVFMDETIPLSSKPLIAMITAAMEVVTNGWRYEDVMRYIKSGYSGISIEQAFVLQNYAYTWNIRGNGWTRAGGFIFNPDGMRGPITPEGLLRLDELNGIRERVAAPLMAFRKAARGGARGISRALYALLLELAVPDALEAEIAALKLDGRHDLAQHDAQLWNTVISVMDQLVLVMGDEELSLSRYAELFAAAVDECALGAAPSSLDAVTVGSADRMRTLGARCAFVVGLNEGEFPRGDFAEGIITDADRESLKTLGVELADTGEGRLMQEQFHLYCAITAGSRKLYLCHAAADLAGAPKRPSYMHARAASLLGAKPGPPPSGIDAVEGAEASLSLLCALPDGDPLKSALRGYYGQSPLAARADGLCEHKDSQPDDISPVAAHDLYGDSLIISPTSLDSWAGCRFAYFCRYGLLAKPLRQARMDAPEIGTFVHFVMERLFVRLDGRALQYIPQETVYAWLAAITREYVTLYLQGMDDRTARFRYLFERLGQVVRSFVDMLRLELSGCSFKPLAFELRIGEGGVAPMRTDRAVLRGVADRVDGLERDGALYARVVDYKTGAKDFSLSDVYQGMDIQLLFYLFSLWQSGEEYFGMPVRPAGVLYARAQNPVVTAARGDSDGAIRKKRARLLRMDGLLANDTALLRAMEPQPGAMLPVALDRDGNTKAGAPVASERDFALLRTHVLRTIEGMSDDVLGGVVEPNPFRYGKNSCQYCDMATVCGFEDGDARGRAYEKLKDGEVWARLHDSC